jgi:tripartite ATP-independent transporter DctM subunit
MVLYALVSDTSVGYLFIGGAIPGLLIGAVLMAYNHWIAVRRGFPVDEKVPLARIPRTTLRAFPVLLMPFILLYGIYGGIATPTEAAAMAATYALLLAAFFYRELTWRGLYNVLLDSTRSSASVGLLIGGALIFNYIVASENIPGTVSAWLTGIDISPLAFLISVNLLLLVLGCLLDASTIILVILPLFVPTCKALGIDLVHFGVVTIVNAMIGLITPPYGVLLFVTNAVTGIPLRAMIAEIWGFIAVLIVALFAMILFPDIVLWLPRMFGYQGG